MRYKNYRLNFKIFNITAIGNNKFWSKRKSDIE